MKLIQRRFYVEDTKRRIKRYIPTTSTVLIDYIVGKVVRFKQNSTGTTGWLFRALVSPKFK
jgi:hypothetical protein